MPYFVILAVALLIALAALWVHLGFRPPRVRGRRTPADLGWTFREVHIETARRRRLVGWLIPGRPEAPAVVMLHGWGGNSEMLLPLAAPFVAAGMTLLMVDARNHGHSDGDTFSSLPRFAEDTDAAVEWLRREGIGAEGGVALIGHSLGAAAVLLAASRRADLRAVIAVAAFAHPEWMMRRWLAGLPRPLMPVVLGYVEWVIGHRFEAIAPMHAVCRVRCPVLLVHGREDRLVPHTDTLAIAERCPEPHIHTLLVEGAGHGAIERIGNHGGELVAFVQAAPRPRG